MTRNDIVCQFESYQDAQRLRIKASNRLAALQRRNEYSRYAIEWLAECKALEASLKQTCISSVETLPVYQDLIDLHAISDALALPLVCYIDIHRANYASNVWSYAGIATDSEGNAQGRKVGEKINYNPKLRVHLWNLGSSFIKHRSPYKEIYDNWKGRYRAKREGGVWDKKLYPDARLDKMARRKMVKIFLEHFWFQWRSYEGLPTPTPWAFAFFPEEHPNDDYIDKAEFGWPEVSSKIELQP